MATTTLDLAIFDSLDELVKELETSGRFDTVRSALVEIYEESDKVIDCLDKVWCLIALLSNPETAATLNPIWQQELANQTKSLNDACDDLMAVATSILPHRAISLISKELH